MREQSRRLDDACAAIGRDPTTIDRLLLTGVGTDRPLASLDAFLDVVRRYAGLGFTDLVIHHPRADDPAWDDSPEMIERVATEVLPTLS